MGRRKLVGPFAVIITNRWGGTSTEEPLELEQARERLGKIISDFKAQGYAPVKEGAHLYTKQAWEGDHQYQVNVNVKVYNAAGELVTNEILASA